jgi:hypothetical protein
VHVLVQSQHWLLSGDACELVDQRLERPPFPHFRGQGQRGIALAGRDSEQGGQQGHGLIWLVARAAEQRL